MKKFEFANNELKIEIAGHEYVCDPAVTLAATAAAHKDLSAFNTILQSGDVSRKEVGDIMENQISHLEDALVPEAAKDIFKGRTICLHDITDVLIYIKACCIDFEAKKQEQYRNVLADK